MIDCTDCFWCKINRSKGTLRCKGNIDHETFSYWIKSNGTEKVFKLKVFEIKKSFVEWRDIFNLAQNCPSMKSMS